MKVLTCYHDEYCENYLTTGKNYKYRGEKKEYGLIEILCKDGKYRWFNKYRFEGGVENETYWSNIRLGYHVGTSSHLDSYPSGNYSKWYYNQNGTKR